MAPLNLEDSRFEDFRDNVNHIRKTNKKKRKYKLKLNKFSNSTLTEFNHAYSCTGMREHKTEQVPDSFDMRQKGAVTDVKTQGKCGKSSKEIFRVFLFLFFFWV